MLMSLLVHFTTKIHVSVVLSCWCLETLFLHHLSLTLLLQDACTHGSPVKCATVLVTGECPRTVLPVPWPSEQEHLEPSLAI